MLASEVHTRHMLRLGGSEHATDGHESLNDSYVKISRLIRNFVIRKN